MKILFAMDRYQPSRGGAERYLRDLGAALEERGHSISVAALQVEEDSFTKQLIVKAPSVPRLAREVAFSRAVGRWKGQGRFDRVVGFRHVMDADRFQPHEGLFLDSLKGSIRSMTRNPALKTLLLLKKLASPKNLFFLHADRALFKNNPGLEVAALSQMTARSIEERFGDRKPKVSVIPNGVDPHRFSPLLDRKKKLLLRREAGLPEQGHLILFAAHNFRLKGLKEALHGLARYGRAARLVVIGRGKKARYQQLCHRLGVEKWVHFLGERSDMIRWFSMADLLLHPTFYDPCSLVVLEALGSGVPVITTRFNGAAERMKGENGGWVLDDPRDFEAMADAMRAILDAGQYSSFQEEALKLGTRFHFTEHVNRMEQWIT